MSPTAREIQSSSQTTGARSRSRPDSPAYTTFSGRRALLPRKFLQNGDKPLVRGRRDCALAPRHLSAAQSSPERETDSGAPPALLRAARAPSAGRAAYPRPRDTPDTLNGATRPAGRRGHYWRSQAALSTSRPSQILQILGVRQAPPSLCQSACAIVGCRREGLL